MNSATPWGLATQRQTRSLKSGHRILAPSRQAAVPERPAAAHLKCHPPLDPVGLALENFDGIGQGAAQSSAGGLFVGGFFCGRPPETERAREDPKNTRRFGNLAL